MAFDGKRLKTMQWLNKLACKKIAGLPTSYNPYAGKIFAQYGRLYSTNGYILAAIEYAEFEHIADFGYMEIDTFEKDGKLLELPILKEMDKQPSKGIFENMFIDQVEYNQSDTFNPYLIAECMRPFKINDISPIIVHGDKRIEFVGHNDDVSIKVIMMGEN